MTGLEALLKLAIEKAECFHFEEIKKGERLTFALGFQTLEIEIKVYNFTNFKFIINIDGVNYKRTQWDRLSGGIKNLIHELKVKALDEIRHSENVERDKVYTAIEKQINDYVRENRTQ